MLDRRKMLQQAKKGVQEAFSKKDASLIHAVRSIDDLDAVKSLIHQRLDEWYKINFPEFEVGTEEAYAKIVSEFGDKDFDLEKLTEIVGENKAIELMQKAEKSFGANFDLHDKNAIRKLAKALVNIIETRKELEEYVREKAKRELKNISYLTDELLAARLVSLAGGIDKLAEMPASTIQVIGAEKALFKHLKKGTLPPKHGIIFQNPHVNSAPLGHRGKIARALAAKIAIASKADAFTGNFIAPKLKATLDKRFKQIKAMPFDPNKKLQKPLDDKPWKQKKNHFKKRKY